MDTKLETTGQNKHRELSPGLEKIRQIVLNKQDSKIAINNINSNNSSPEIERKQDNRAGRQTTLEVQAEQQQIQPQAVPTQHNHHYQPLQQHQPAQQFSKRCRPPSSRKFAHPCTCNLPNGYQRSYPTTNSSSLPAAATPLQLYDTVTKKCLPTSRFRDMLFKECHSHPINSFPAKQHHNAPCFYDDLICDSRRFRCVCKPSLHLYYESTNQTSTFGCVPIGPNSSPDGRINCKSGYIYNVISKDCQKIFDVNELPQNYTTGVSATQFSFVTIVLIWILLLILIVTAKLRKLRSSNLYRNSPSAERRHHNHGNLSYRHQSHNASAWLHPFIAAVNGHHQFNQHHRSTVDRHSQGASDESGNYNDTDFFLSGGNRRINDMLSDHQNFAGSQQSLNNPPPKFEEIYPTCNEDGDGNIIRLPPPPPPPPPSPPLPTNEDLPSYDEAMKLQNTVPLDNPPKE